MKKIVIRLIIAIALAITALVFFGKKAGIDMSIIAVIIWLSICLEVYLGAVLIALRK